MATTKNVLEGLAKQSAVPTDSISAKLTVNEYVIPADVVIALGHGDEEQGIAFLDNLVEQVRQKTQGMLGSVNKGGK